MTHAELTQAIASSRRLALENALDAINAERLFDPQPVTMMLNGDEIYNQAIKDAYDAG